MDCSICEGFGEFKAHEYVMSLTSDYWRPMTRVPEHMKQCITEWIDESGVSIFYKRCLCCDGTGKSKVK